MKSCAFALIVLILLSVNAVTVWNKDNDKIADDLMTEVSGGKDIIIVVLYKDGNRKEKIKILLEEKFKDEPAPVAYVDMNSNKYMDLARELHVSTAKDTEYPIIAIMKGGSGKVIKQNGNVTDEKAVKQAIDALK